MGFTGRLVLLLRLMQVTKAMTRRPGRLFDDFAQVVWVSHAICLYISRLRQTEALAGKQDRTV